MILLVAHRGDWRHPRVNSQAPGMWFSYLSPYASSQNRSTHITNTAPDTGDPKRRKNSSETPDPKDLFCLQLFLKNSLWHMHKIPYAQAINSWASAGREVEKSAFIPVIFDCSSVALAEKFSELLISDFSAFRFQQHEMIIGLILSICTDCDYLVLMKKNKNANTPQSNKGT